MRLRYSRPYRSLTWQQQLKLQCQWEENAEAGNICEDHSHPEPCPVCMEEVAAERRADEIRERKYQGFL